ncbi:MAG: hypothetical protein BGO98_34205 [Myxococcales bacterium 68-20]|nr:MAG: hypothetical protein BGO98_34205 [Myxococcales bacterium 68-20]
MRRPVRYLALSALTALTVVACGDGPDANSPGRSQLADKWLSRAQQSYRSGDAEDASVAIEGALKAAPRDRETRLLASRIALSRLEFEEAIKLSEGLEGSDAKSVRGRAFWYTGDIERAADELEDMLKDPAVKDPWARDVAKLARRGHGRHPFAIEGAVVAAVEMPGAGGPALVVPCELDGERILALVATNFGELMVDSSSRKEPAWVSLRFGESFEVKDVPALTHDLSGISRTLGATIKALIGVNVLRHMHVTFDRRGSQFVVRKDEPMPPPEASKMPVFYARGGAMMMRASISNKDDGNALLFVDSSAFYPLALEDAYLKRSGANLSTFRSEPGAPPSWKMGSLPYFKLGGIDISGFPAVQGAPFNDYKNSFDVELGGIAGAGLLSVFRVTFAESGKSLWLELDPSMGGPGGLPLADDPHPHPSGAPAPSAPSGAPGPTEPGAGAKPQAPKPPAAPKSEPPKPGPTPDPKSQPPVPKAATPTESKGAAR